jgi:hypothetical protein
VFFSKRIETILYWILKFFRMKRKYDETKKKKKERRFYLKRETYSKVYEELYNSKKYYDVIIKFGSKEIKTHKNILYSSSKKS